MKNIILTFLIFVLYTGCSEDEQTNQETTIYGKWELSEQFFSSVGGDGDWQSATNKYFIEFSLNKNYQSSNNPICPSNPSNIGTFSFSDEKDGNYIIIDLVCEESDNDVFSLKYLYYFEGGNLLLSPTFSCDEGCIYKFRKVAEPKAGD
ncbi:hypothetical protein [Ekhidna sp.]|uniref:hypothetical protein n=1 Tax=Ekhidna sp. TaxID=2608089 RepID=UPI003512734D